MSNFSASELDCSMRAPEVRGLVEAACGRLRKCFRCAGPLPPRRRWWCSDECVNIWSRNHEWTAARWEALRLSAKLPRGEFENDLLQKAQCDHCASPINLEVNHVDPRRGRGYSRGCWNHQSNLQVLCHTCHLVVTKRQRVEHPVVLALESGLLTADQAQEIIDTNMVYMGRAARKRLGLLPLKRPPMPGFDRSRGL